MILTLEKEIVLHIIIFKKQHKFVTVSYVYRIHHNPANG